MTILILTNSINGLYCFRKEVVSAIICQGYKVVISAPFVERKNYFDKIGCKLVNTPFRSRGINPIKDLGLTIQYIRLVKQETPDIILSYTIKPNLYGGIACQICRIPQIVNVTGLGSAVENPGWLQKLTILLYKACMRKVHTMFFQNSANMLFCKKHRMAYGDIKLLPGSGVNLDYNRLTDYPSKEESIKFIFIGRLLREKGLDEYLCAAEVIKKRYPSTEFHIVGSCEEKYDEKIKELVDKGVVFYHGSQPDVRPFIAKVHCTVHPSYYPEGMSNVLLESCAIGRPIITTNRPGCGEIIDNNVNGFVVKQKDTRDLIFKIEKFIELPYSDKKLMGLAARAKVEKEFDRSIVVKTYMETIASIISTP